MINWQVIDNTFLRSIQFPSRLFIFSTFFMAISLGIYLKNIENPLNKKVIHYFIFILLSSAQYMISVDTIETTSYDNNNILHKNWIGSGEEYLPKETNISYLKKNNKISHNKKFSKIYSINKEGSKLSFKYTAKKKDVITLPIIYYKGYKLTINDKKVQFKNFLN